MDNRKNIGIVGTCVAVIVAVVGISIVWAAYSSNLTIKGNATAEQAKWSVIFKDLSAATTGNTQEGVTSTATETTSPSIVGSTSIENFEISIKTPGDFVSYTFKIRNDGSFPAKIDSSFSMPTPTCSKVCELPPCSVPKPGVMESICSNYSYTLTYTNGGAAVSAGDTFAAGEEKEVILKLAYKDTIASSDLPTEAIEISGLNITIPFVQQ